MTNNKYFISVGYPMGRVQFEDDTFLLQVKEGMYKLNGLQNFIWQAAWELSEVNAVENAFREFEGGNYIKELKNSLKDLINKGLIIEISTEDYEKVYEKIKNISFDKQGVGIGFVPNEENDINSYAIQLGDLKKVTLIQYMIWCKGNGNTSLNDTLIELDTALGIKSKENIEEIIFSIITLYSNKLMYFKG